jgi:hypothetical protein
VSRRKLAGELWSVADGFWQKGLVDRVDNQVLWNRFADSVTQR